MKGLLIALFVALVHSEPIVTLFPDGAPGEVEGWPGPEVAIVGSDGTTRLYNVPAPTLSVFLSNQSVAGAGLAPAVIIAPGGGYSHLSIDKEGTDVAARFNTMGVHAFVLKYRVPARPETDPSLPKWWAPLMDAQRTVSYVRAHAADYGANASAASPLAGTSRRTSRRRGRRRSTTRSMAST